MRGWVLVCLALAIAAAGMICGQTGAAAQGNDLPQLGTPIPSWLSQTGVKPMSSDFGGLLGAPLLTVRRIFDSVIEQDWSGGGSSEQAGDGAWVDFKLYYPGDLVTQIGTSHMQLTFMPPDAMDLECTERLSIPGVGEFILQGKQSRTLETIVAATGGTFKFARIARTAVVTPISGNLVDYQVSLFYGPGTLNIQSTPAPGIPVTLAQADLNGEQNGPTELTRVYPEGLALWMSVPEFVIRNGIRYDFDRWNLDNVDQAVGVRALSLVMSKNRTAIAKYLQARVLSVVSTPITGPFIGISPTDQNGAGSGATNLTRSYTNGTTVTLSAPSIYIKNGITYNFAQWRLDGTAQPAGQRVISFIMNADRATTAEYQAAP